VDYGQDSQINIVKNYSMAWQTDHVTSSSAIAERPRDARGTSIRKITKLNF